MVRFLQQLILKTIWEPVHDHLGSDRIGAKKGQSDRIARCKFPVWEVAAMLCRRDRIGKITRIGFPYG
jgi:hypothetical protein